ncbi:hypothetical protein AWB81_07013 [Caballeronia arationis]|uniref:hypothetical protein n=1 Tax=Caballeronia arationis TaxID=1777142 RepID=UPI00074BC704|nr:hypothetical protein [Caballeronia arationis]SAL05091.1 hypothetical protein AWB81_07013 [Caballeronia arationis]
MALAILELQAMDAGSARFRIDTGSNRYYQLKVGRGVTQRLEMEWVDDVYRTLPLASNPAAGNLIDSHTQAAIPLSAIDKGKAYVQLFTFKSADGRSPSFSDVLAIGDSVRLPDPPANFALPQSLTPAMTRMQTLPRVVPCRTGRQALAQQNSLDGLLGDIAKAAVPVVAGLLKGGGTSTPSPTATPGAAPAAASVSPASAAGSDRDLIGFLSSLLTQLIAGAGGLSQSQSTRRRIDGDNRFSAAQSAELSHALVAPALLAFIGPLLDGIVKVLPGVIGPIAQNTPQFLGQLNQHLPMLINSINQKEMQSKAADNKFATDTLAQVSQRMIAQDFLHAQQLAPGGTPIDPAALLQLLQMLQQASPPAAPTPDPSAASTAPALPPPVAVAKSLVLPQGDAPSPSRRAVLTFSDGPTQLWNGSQRVLYARDRSVQLKLRLMVAPPVPSGPLPKAILKIAIKERADKSVLVEKMLKLKDIAANSEIAVPLAVDEVARLATNRPVTAYAELRWLNGASGGQSAAVGSTEFIVVAACFVKQQRAAVSPEREPRDMNVYRSFWNKLWESPVIDEAGSRRARPSQVLWELDVNAKYSVLLSADHDANGVMESRLLLEKDDPEDISARTQGRLKGGMELSIAALTQLLPLWDGAAPLAPEQIEALRAQPVADANASELIYRLRLGGKAGQRGIVWVLPVFRLFEFALGRVRDTDDSGRVTGVTDETVRYPLPVAARLVGIKSEH